MSFAQQRLWFLQQLDPESSAYNESEAFRLVGRLDFAVLVRAIRELLRRHDILRTTFCHDGELRQIVHPAPNPDQFVSFVDLRELAAELQERVVRTEIERTVRAPFDLEAGPLLRVSVIREGNERHVIVVSMHHAISDGWSMGIFTDELAALYKAFSAGKRSPLPDLPLQYADYAYWQRTWLEKGSFAE
ncbi:MAG: non-ribosomal peptide synthetase, partial [Chloroflexi bacterium]|nr:non-ribosomal peptide synthetase [Chloroflexota bacterium]